MFAERVLVYLGPAAAAAAVLVPLAGFLGLDGLVLALPPRDPAVAIPAGGPGGAAALAGLFAAAGLWGRGRRARLVLLALTAAVLAVLAWLDRWLPLRLAAAVPGLLAGTAAWLRSFWYGTASPPPVGTGVLLFSAAAWAYCRGMWRVIARRSGWPAWYAAGVAVPVVLWVYGDPEAARRSLLGLTTAMLLSAPALGLPAAGTRASGTTALPAGMRTAPTPWTGARPGGWLRLVSAVAAAAAVLTTAAALPALEPRPVPLLHQGIQRLIPMTARGPGAGFGGVGQGSPKDPLTLGGPFRPAGQELLAVTVSARADLPGTLYLRGVARPVYTGTTLEAASPNRLQPFTGSVDLPTRVLVLWVEQEIEVRGPSGRVLYGARAVWRVGPRGRLRVYTDADGSLFALRPLPSGTLYRVSSFVPWLAPADVEALLEPEPLPDPGPPPDSRYLDLPEALPQRVVDLARRVTDGAVSPYHAALLIENYLRRFPYHTDTPFTPPGRDFVDYFLFDLQAGYCTYYAAAMMVMLRAVGIPSRVVEGFILPLDGPGTYVVTGAQAHTWVEAWIPGYGWLTFEPTPAYPPSPGAPAAGVDAPEESHGPAAPDLLDPGTPPVPVPADLPGALPAPALPGGAAAGGTGAPGSAAAWPAALAAAAGLAGMVLLLARRRAQAAAPDQQIGRLYLRARALVTAAAARAAGASANGAAPAPGRPGTPWLRPAAQTPAELVGSAAAWPAALAAPLEALTALYHEAAFGPPHRRPGTGAALRAREAARALARGLRREMGWYRYLGAAAAARLAPEAVPEGSHPPGDAAQRPIPRS